MAAEGGLEEMLQQRGKPDVLIVGIHHELPGDEGHRSAIGANPDGVPALHAAVRQQRKSGRGGRLAEGNSVTAALAMRSVGRIVRFIRTLFIGLGFSAGVLIGGAVPTVAAFASSAEQDALAPTPEPLANFTHFELRAATMSDEIKEDPDKVAVANALVAELGTRLRPVIDEWNARQSSDREARVLIIQPRIREIRVVSNMSRLFVGAFAGNSYVDLDLVLTVDSADASFATARIHREASATSGGTSRGRSDENLIRFSAAIARQYLLDNYRPE